MTTTPTTQSKQRRSAAGALSALMLLLGTTMLQAQVTGPEQDCFNAIPVCNGTYTQTRSYTGEGRVPNEIPPGTTCLLQGEKNDVWYIFTVKSSGNLNFTITPLDSDDDYDWSVYNLTGTTCTAIRNGTIAPTSCNFSPAKGTTGATRNDPNAPTSQDANGTPFNRLIPVTTGETYVLNVSNFSESDQSGYSLNFTNSTAEILDQAPPLFQSVRLASQCDNSSIIATFSENVKCSSVQPTDFRLTGPGGPYTVTSVFSAACASGGSFDDNFTVVISPELSISGTYTLEYITDADGVLDICDNVAIPARQTFAASPLVRPTINIDGPTTLCSCQELILTAPPGFSEYRWSNGETTQSINVTEGGDYNVRVTDARGCTSRSEDVRVTRLDAESTINLPAAEIHGSPGDTVTIPIDIASSRFLDFCGARSYTIRLSYNRNILKALEGNIVGTNGDITVLELKGRRGDTVGVLARPRFVAMLGNAENTPIVVESAGWDECATLTLSNGGGFQLDNLCREGGTRLYRSGPSPTLKPVRPSPVRESVTIDYALGVDAHVRIAFVDLMGTEVAVVVDGDRMAGEGSVRVDLSQLPPGLYICTMTAQSETHSQMVEVVR